MKTDTRNSLLRNPLSFDGTVYLSVQFQISQSISTPSNPCHKNSTAYDSCIQNNYLNQIFRTNSCLLPFLRQTSKFNYCNTFESGMKSLALYQNISLSCLNPCILLIPELTLQLENQYITNSLTQYTFYTKFMNTHGKSGLFISLPKDFEFIQSKFIYSAFYAIGDFLSIACLLFGISAFGFLMQIHKFANWTSNIVGLQMSRFKFIMNIFKVIVGFASSGLILWILIVFITKYASFPIETHVDLEARIPNLSLAFCNSKNMTLDASRKIEVWKNETDVQKKISKFEIMNSAGNWITLWKRSFSQMTDMNIFTSIIFPLTNQTLQFCQILDLQLFPDLNKVKCIIICKHFRR